MTVGELIERIIGMPRHLEVTINLKGLGLTPLLCVRKMGNAATSIDEHGNFVVESVGYDCELSADVMHLLTVPGTGDKS